MFKKTTDLMVTGLGPPVTLTQDLLSGAMNGPASYPNRNIPSHSGGCKGKRGCSARNPEAVDLLVSEPLRGTKHRAVLIILRDWLRCLQPTLRAGEANIDTNTQGGADARSGRQGLKRKLVFLRWNSKHPRPHDLLGKTLAISKSDIDNEVDAIKSEAGQTSIQEQDNVITGTCSNPDATDPMVVEGDEGSAIDPGSTGTSTQQTEQIQLPLHAACDGTSNVTCNLCHFT